MRYPILVALLLTSSLPAAARQATVTAADYERGERLLRQHTTPLVFGPVGRPTWIDDDRFWYRNRTPAGTEFVLIDADRRARAPAFDHDRLARALSGPLDSTVSGGDLPFTTFEFVDGGRAIALTARGRRVRCDLEAYVCRPGPGPAGVDRNTVVSPDGRYGAFIRDHNLWLRDLESGRESPLTTDGIEHFGYATNNAGWIRSDRPVLVWSPDSRKIATFQHDARGVGDMYMVTTEVGHPRLEAWKYPLPEDSVIFRISRVIIDVDTRRVVRLQLPPDPHRSTICDHVYCGGTWADVEWAPDASALAFVSSSRDHKSAQLRIADPETGAVRDIMGETVDTFYESGFNSINWRFLPASNEILWYSQRDDWGHLYLYDLNTGRLKRQVTSGDWNVLQLLRVDQDRDELIFTGAGREPGDPYFQHLYRVGMNGRGLRHLTPDSANHTVTLSPGGDYFVDSYSTPVDPPVTVLRDRNGRVVMPLEVADISQLIAAGWEPPIPFTVKARDGVTDLYGLMYRPTNFDPTRSYPVLNYLYPGPQTGSVGSRSFVPSRSDKQAIAELGFIVVEVDAMGTPMRSKSFHEYYYGKMGDNGVPDQVATIRQLAERHTWMDLDRVGIWGHSGGGFASTAAILTFPDFYKVAVSQAGNHDNRNYEDDWGEKWQGLLEEYPDGSTNYDNQANQLKAENLKGKLLLAHGTMDTNVPHSSTMLVVDALIEANKEFDLILFPNRGHGFGNTPYMMLRRWNYFVRHLLHQEPPTYEFGTLPPRRPLVP